MPNELYRLFIDYSAHALVSLSLGICKPYSEVLDLTGMTKSGRNDPDYDLFPVIVSENETQFIHALNQLGDIIFGQFLGTDIPQPCVLTYQQAANQSEDNALLCYFSADFCRYFVQRACDRSWRMHVSDQAEQRILAAGMLYYDHELIDFNPTYCEIGTQADFTLMSVVNRCRLSNKCAPFNSSGSVVASTAIRDISDLFQLTIGITTFVSQYYNEYALR